MGTDTGTGTKTRAAIMGIATAPNQSCESYSAVLLQANTDGGSLEASASELQAGGTAPLVHHMQAASALHAALSLCASHPSPTAPN